MDKLVYESIVTLANAETSAIYEVTDATYQTTYIAFGKRGATALTESVFAVCRYQKTLATGVTTIMWANGTKQRLVDFDAPASLSYSYLK